MLQLVLTLSHGLATIKRELSENKTILEKNMDKTSIISCCYIKDYMNSNNLTPHEVKITDAIILSVKSERKKI